MVRLAPVVVVSTPEDPATPYQAGMALARELGGRLVTFEGNQRTVSSSSLSSGVACVDNAMSAYLIDLTLPPVGCRERERAVVTR